MKSKIKKILLRILAFWPGRPRATYAQCGEDIILDFIFSGLGISKGTYVDIGANDPVAYSNTYLLYKAGWRGVNIDPQAHCIAKFNRVRPEDQNLQIGVGAKSGLLPLFLFEVDTLSTFDSKVAQQNVQMGHRIIEEKQIPVKTIKNLVDEKLMPQKIEVLSLDTEGGELDLIQQFMNLNIKPTVIICETLDYNPELVKTLKEQKLIQDICAMGYFLYADTYLNSVFVRQGIFDQHRA